MNRSIRVAALGLFGLTLSSPALANPHYAVCIDPAVSVETMADFCRRALDWGGLDRWKQAAAWTNIGFAFAAQNSHGQAIDAFDRAIQIDSRFADAFVMRARSRERRGQVRGALEDYAAALEINPRDYGALTGRGAFYMRRNIFDLAYADFDRAVGVAPRDPDAQFNRGLALSRLGRRAAAITAFSAVLRLNPNDANAYLQRGLVHGLTDTAAAEADFAAAIRLSPQLAAAFVARGRLFDETGRTDQADKDFRRAFELGYQAEWLTERISRMGG